MDVKECCALGRSGYLGEFYDAREDKFCSGSLFNAFTLPPSCVNSVDVNSLNVEYTFEDSYTKRFEKLDVNADLKVSVFAGLLDLKGSGKYLTDEKKSSRSVRGTVLYNIKTKEEKINIYDEELKKHFTLDALANTSATHFVGGIVWGANTFASFEYRKDRTRDLTSITGNLSAELKKLVAEVKGDGDARYQGLNENNSLSYEMKIYGDVIPIDEELPKTRDEALNLLRKTPLYISKCNNGKGKPITFTLYPLTEVAKMLNMQLESHARIHALDSAVVLQTEHVFNELLSTKQEFNDFYEDLSSPLGPYFPVNTIRDITNFKNKLETAEHDLRNEIRKALIKTRSDPSQSFCIQDVLKNFNGGEFAPDKIQEFLAQHGDLQEKMDFISDLKVNKVKYMTSRKYGVDCIRSREKNFYALVFHQTDKIYSSQKWKENYDLFMQLLLDKQGTEVFYVLEMINGSGEEMNEVSIHHCIDLVIQSEDLFKDLSIKKTFALARSTEYEFCSYRPNKSSVIKIRCPGSIYGKCGFEIVNWKCHQTRCNDYLYYGFDSFIYCKCGRAKLSTFSYKCTDVNHGPKWTSFESNDDVIKMMEELVPPEELNILILGETGVGKSTFINAFANYLTYDTLEEAEQKDLVALISTSFTVTDENYEEKLVKFGEDSNESGLSGQSQTQSCRSYTFPKGEKLIRLIDTPGIGDTSGPDKDTRNFENILSFIANYSVLHGICILLKPNNSRISVMFRFCIQELLCHIHKSASENIVFLFTNARGTFYLPGDTLPSLRTLLKDNANKPPHVQIALNKATLYCLDNEAFRFLLAIKNGVTFPESNKMNFEDSWDKSVAECARVLDHFSKIKPHSIHETVSLNDARKLIIFLSRPLCDITQNIQTNIMTIHDQERKIQQAGEDIAKLMKVLHVPIIDLEQKFFKEPRTVCASKKCITVRTIDGQKKIDYTKVCHNPCQLENITAEIINNVELMNCWAMNGTHDCRICGCNYAKHMHIYYENIEVSKQKLDSNVQQEIRTKEDQKREKKRVLEACQIRREKLEREQEVITRASAQFAHFLKTNAIAPYNDALKDYLNHLIVVERQKCNYDSDNEHMVEDLIKMKTAYEEQVKILEQNFHTAGRMQSSTISPNVINDIVNELYSLELNGSLIKNAAEKHTVERQETQVFRERMYHPGYHHPRQDKEGIVQKFKNKLRDLFYNTV